MKKRYAYRHKIWIYICCAAVIIISLVCITVNSLRLAGAADLISPNKAQDIVTIVVLSAVAVIMTWTGFFSGYSIGKKGLIRNLGIFYSTMPWKDIVLVRHDAKNTILLVYYRVDKNGYLKDDASDQQFKFERICIAAKYYEQFDKALRKHAPQAPVEVVDEEAKDDDK